MLFYTVQDRFIAISAKQAVYLESEKESPTAKRNLVVGRDPFPQNPVHNCKVVPELLCQKRIGELSVRLLQMSKSLLRRENPLG